MDLILSLIRDFSMKNMNRILKKGEESSTHNKQRRIFSITSFGLLKYGALGAFYLIVLKGPIIWDFPLGPGHFGTSGSFMMKRMNFKRMIQSSCRVEHAVPDTRQIFQRTGLFSNKPIHLGPCGSTLFPIQRSAFCLYVFTSTIFYR